MWVFGGWDGGRNFADFHKLTLPSNRQQLADGELVWTPVIPAGGQVPSGRRGHTCVLVDGVLLLFGGQDGNNFYNDVHSFQLDGILWSPLVCSGVAPLSRSYHTAVVWQHSMYIFGGTGANWCFFNDLHALHLPTNTWSQVSFPSDN